VFSVHQFFPAVPAFPNFYRLLLLADCGEFDNAGAMMSVDDTLMCSFQILKPAEKRNRYQYMPATPGPNVQQPSIQMQPQQPQLQGDRPNTPPRTGAVGSPVVSNGKPAPPVKALVPAKR
jgi:hypothetical protein